MVHTLLFFFFVRFGQVSEYEVSTKIYRVPGSLVGIGAGNVGPVLVGINETIVPACFRNMWRSENYADSVPRLGVDHRVLLCFCCFC